jgi:methylmalonyl-CoA/ethylmalonyl-CoA epimerase
VKIHHLGVAVRSLRESAKFYRDLLGLEFGGEEEVASEGVRVAFLQAGEPRIELLEPLDEGSAVARHIQKRGEGIHHVCFEVEDLDGAVRDLREGGARLVDPGIRRGAEGSRVAFVHPRSSGGVLVELREGSGNGPVMGPGAVVVLYLQDPPTKIWGRIRTLGEAGVVIQGVDLRSFDDLLFGASSGEMGPADVSVIFYPLRRVEKIILDAGTDSAPSLQDQFMVRVGSGLGDFLDR